MYSSGIAVQRGEGLSLTALYSRESQAGMIAPGCVADDRPGGGEGVCRVCLDLGQSCTDNLCLS
jgi:hypothetical protein